MGSRTLAGSIGLVGDWNEHEAGWKPGVDDNFLWLSVFVQGRVLAQVAAVPGGPAQGDIYLLSSDHMTHPNAIAVYDEGAWHYRAPLAGWKFYNVALSAFVRFDSSLWVTDDALTAVVSTGGGDGIVPDGVVSGCAVIYSGTGLDFIMTAGTFYLNGTLYSAAAQTLSLAAADPALGRIDTLFVYGSGVFGKITGTPAADPEAPDVDSETQLLLLTVLVPAAAVNLNGSISDQLVYDEGVEWVPTVTGATINALSTNSPYSGTKCIEATAAVYGDQVRLVKAAPVQFGTEGNVFLRIKSKGTWETGHLNLFFYSGNRRRGGRVALRHGAFGFDSSNTAGYQLISIPKYKFGIHSDTAVDELRIKAVSSLGIGFYLDHIVLQTPDSGTINITVQAGMTQAEADGRYLRRLGVDNVAATAYTFVVADANRHKRFTAAGAVVATVPPSVFSVGDRVRITAVGAGGTTLAPGAGVTLHSRGGALASPGQYSVFEIECVGINEFDVLGDLS